MKSSKKELTSKIKSSLIDIVENNIFDGGFNDEVNKLALDYIKSEVSTGVWIRDSEIMVEVYTTTQGDLRKGFPTIEFPLKAEIVALASEIDDPDLIIKELKEVINKIEGLKND